MNCQKFENFVSELPRNQIMDADTRRDMFAHAEQCSDCGLQLNEQQKLSDVLSELKQASDKVEVDPDIEARLLTAFRRRDVVQPMLRVRNNRRYWLSAIAATLLLAVGILAVRWQAWKTQPPREMVATGDVKSTGEQHSQAASVNTPSADNLIARKSEVKPRPKHSNFVARVRPHRQATDNNVVANHVVNEVTTDFVPLGYLNAASLQDGGQIVRVELPRSAMASFGYPVNMDRYNEKVKADILLGIDGQARAIRFVQ